MQTAVILMNLGGPDSLEAIEPFLFNLFSDPDIFKIPIGQKLFAKLISRSRASKVAEEYKLIGGKSPINEWTEIQRRMLETKLNENNIDAKVFVAMRYWKPLTEETISLIEQSNFEKILLVPLYPHYSITTIGSSFNEWRRKYKGDVKKLIYINEYYLNEKYLSAVNQRINEGLQQFPISEQSNVQFVFSAHGTPVSLVKKGDPYSRQIKETMEAIMKLRNYSHEYHLCFQSKVGPQKWLEPATDQMIEKLAAEGNKNLLIIPISFVSDHVETLYELDIEYRQVAEKAGIKNYVVMKGLNDSNLFIDALYELVKNNIN